MRVGILGATGFIGRHLTTALRKRGDEVLAASMRKPADAAQTVRGCEAVINLAGEPVAQRWTPEVKRKIEESRTVEVRAFLDALAEDEKRPTRFVCASAIGYYGTSETATFTEASGPGTDFLAQVCVQWEAQAQSARDLGMEVTCIRTGLALGRDGGALAKIIPPFKLGAGGRIGSGKQWISWVHIDDVVAIYMMALDGVSGILNATAPNPVRNDDFTKSLGRALNRPTFFPVPGAAIAAVLGEGAYVLTEGQRVLPERTQAAGYRFKYETVDGALANLL
jgi:hypothetical protein